MPTVKELRAEAKRRGIRGRSRMSKAKLIAALGGVAAPRKKTAGGKKKTAGGKKKTAGGKKKTAGGKKDDRRRERLRVATDVVIEKLVTGLQPRAEDEYLDRYKQSIRVALCLGNAVPELEAALGRAPYRRFAAAFRTLCRSGERRSAKQWDELAEEVEPMRVSAIPDTTPMQMPQLVKMTFNAILNHIGRNLPRGPRAAAQLGHKHGKHAAETIVSVDAMQLDGVEKTLYEWRVLDEKLYFIEYYM